MTRSEYRNALARYFHELKRSWTRVTFIPDDVTEAAFDALDAADEATRRQVTRIQNWMNRWR